MGVILLFNAAGGVNAEGFNYYYYGFIYFTFGWGLLVIGAKTFIDCIIIAVKKL